MTWTEPGHKYRKAKVEVVSTEKLTDLIERVWFVPVPPKDWQGGYPLSDYVPLDNIYRTSIGCAPPEPEFWRRNPAATPGGCSVNPPEGR